MKSNELRIGNLVYYNGNKMEIGVISKIAKSIVPNVDYVGIDGRQDINYQCKHIKPVPFTEEWLLLKFDSIRKEENRIFWSNFGSDAEGYFLWISGFKRYIKYVHDFQNLYFGLTCKELSYGKLK